MLLRYPGGKAKIYSSVKEIILQNGLEHKIYCEPYSGGFGLGIKLLLKGDMQRFIINDLDRHIYAFWHSVFFDTDRLIDKIQNTPITMDEWHHQKDIYLNANTYNENRLLDIGFSTLFLNRTNFSGILTGGPIGGLAQHGLYTIDCRFNRERLVKCVRDIAAHRENVEVYNYDALHLIRELKAREQDIFYNFDPPYVGKGPALYLNALVEQDHINLRNAVNNVQTKWIMTYDNVKLIKDLYKDYKQKELELLYSVSVKRKDKELMISNLARIAI